MGNRYKGILGAVIAAAALMFAAGEGLAATYYVDNQSANASDDNPGTLAAPWLTIQHAADTAQAGDVVLVKPGVYTESVKLSQSGAASARITFRGEPGAVLDGSAMGDCWYCSGFVNWWVNPDSGYEEFSRADFITIDGFEIRNYQRGVYAEPAVFDCPPDWQNCLNLGGSGWTVTNNTIHGCYEGISMWSSNSPEDAYLVANNTLYDNTWTDIHTHRYSTVERNLAFSHAEEENIRSCTAYYFNGATHQVNNNTIMNGTYGIQMAYPGSTYRNNIIMNNAPRFIYTDWNGVDVYQGGWAFQNELGWQGYDLSTVTISYNDLFNVYGAVGTREEQQELPSAATGNISVDPLFVNYTGDVAGDYHLTSGSACIDAGDPADPVPAGGGARIDIGAFEYQLDLRGLIAAKHAFYDAGQIDNRGIMVSLDAKLNAANAALLRGQVQTAAAILHAFIREAGAQSGKHLTTGAARELIEDARMLLSVIETKSKSNNRQTAKTK